MIQGTQESFPSGYFFALSKTAVSYKEHFLTRVDPHLTERPITTTPEQNLN